MEQDAGTGDETAAESLNAATEEPVSKAPPKAEPVGLQKMLESEKRKSEDYLSKLRYLQADFENYRKRIDKEMRELEDFSTTRVVTKLLPVVDELELAMRSIKPGGDGAEVLEGVSMVHKNLLSVLEAEGLKRIEAEGKPFDPDLHEAVEKVQGTAPGEDKVLEVIRTGYTLKGRVLRPTLVRVELADRAKPENHKNGEIREGGNA